MSMDLAETQKLRLRLVLAKGEFAAFLQDRPQYLHFLSASSRDAPSRRIEGTMLKSKKLLNEIDKEYVWDASKCRWTRKDGAMIVLEGEIHDVILSYFRQLKERSWDELWPRIHREVAGVLETDLREAGRLWNQYNLKALDKSDDALWGGPPLLQVSETRDSPQQNAHMSTSGFAEDSASDSANEVAQESAGESMDESESELRDHSMESMDAGEGTSTGLNNTIVPAVVTSGPHFRETSRGVLALEVGRSPQFNTSVWVSMVRCKDGHLLTRYYDKNMNWCKGTDLNVIWNEPYKLSNFEGRFHKRQQSQRQHIFKILTQMAKSRSLVTAAASGVSQDSLGLPRSKVSEGRVAKTNQPRGRPRRRYHVPSDDDNDVEPQTQPLRRIKREPLAPMPSNGSDDDIEIISSNPAPQISPRTNSEGHNSTTHARPKRQLLSKQFTPHELARTRFLVNSSLQLGQTPAHVPLKDCASMTELFAAVAGACKISTEDAKEITEISVLFVWNGEQETLRKHRPYNWVNFCNILRRAWDEEAAWFEKEGCCKVRMVALISEKCKKEKAGTEVKCEREGRHNNGKLKTAACDDGYIGNVDMHLTENVALVSPSWKKEKAGAEVKCE